MLASQSKSKLCGCIFWLICLFSITAVSQIISPERLFGRYRQFVWQDQHGLPQNGISAVVQTSDGYLWLATAEGAVRFDGVNFTAFNTDNTPEIKSNNVQSLLVDRGGTLWIGTHGGGLTRYQNGHFTNYSTEQGLSDTHARSLFEDKAGNLWIGTDGGGLNLFREGNFTAYSVADGLPDNRIGAIAEDDAGNLWIGTNGGLARRTDGKFTVFTKRDGLAGNNIRALFFDREDNLWVGGADGLSRFQNGTFSVFGAKEGLKNNNIRAIAQDGEGSLWFGTEGGGLVWLKDGQFEAATTTEGLINDIIQSVHADREGDLWLGTSGGGLARLKTGNLNVYTRPDGLSGDMVLAIYEDRTGGIWVAAEDGLSRFSGGKFTAITAPDGSSLRGISGISEDGAGNFWIHGDRQTGNKVLKWREENSTVEFVNEKRFDNRAAVVLNDRSGNLWFGTSYDGLHLWRGAQETVFHKADGLADEYVNVLYEDKQGDIWIGTRAGLSRFKNGQIMTFSSLTGKHILSFHEDFRGNLWIGTHGDGLFRFRDGNFARITAKDGLYDNLAFQILEDDNENLWMSGNKGIYRASLSELEEFADASRVSVNSFAYGSADGMLSRECNGANPAGIRARDGRLWFPTIKGVVVINPREMDTQQPNLVVEQVLIDKKILPVGAEIEMLPEQENLEIQFTALSWSRPQQIRFKYQLVGLDENWIEVGTRRTAYFTHLPPGEYVFKVIADNGEGVWNMEGKSLRIIVLPPFYQTWWFIVLCALAVVLMIRLVYGYRLAQLEKINAAKTAFAQQLIESQEAERKRVAAELHDGLGQSLLVIKNRASLGKMFLDDRTESESQFDEISAASVQAIEEVRQIAYNLRPYHLDRLGLTQSIEAMIEKIEETTDIEFNLHIENLDGVFSNEQEVVIYRIVQESVSNIIKHSKATIAGVEIQADDAEIAINIRDNGQGFAPTDGKTPRQGGFGLIGLKERVIMLRGNYQIETNKGKGTGVFVKIPLPLKDV